MPRREPSAYVWDIRDACRRIDALTGNMTRKDYFEDERTRLAVERVLTILGEALGQLAKIDEAMAQELGDVSRIVAFRNILVHGYFALDHEKIWDVIQNYVPDLRAASESLWTRFAHLYPEDPHSP